MAVQAVVAVVVGALASPVLTAAVSRVGRCDKCRRWESAYWELRIAVGRGEAPPDLPPGL